ncbi:hypothetical protein CHS0354_011658 [Potamilus streckersoni]|uniref:UBC core domain-containing protein n=1 Tax=Potamilus streckersoni TaxID=2493646 RepID=A0AAE0WFF9_9BIVA|nr:hypothetical protein CHS0354_011658 [Potamilus streckersoni]
MYSRAHILIEREYEKFKTDPPWGIEASPLSDDNIFEWGAKVQGLKDTIWEGGTFRLYIKFDENFNYRPPEVCFHTIPYHPNVDMITGKPCIDFLDDFSKWKDTYSLSDILLTIQSLLANPYLHNPVNPEAAEMIVHSPQAYRQMVLDCVSASQRLEAGALITPHEGLDSRVRFELPQGSTKQFEAQKSVPPRISKLSFEDYHLTWSGIATSKAKQDSKNPFLEVIKDNTLHQKIHLGLPREEIEEQMKRQLEEHDTLMYGRFQNKPTVEEEKATKLARLHRMRKIYIAPRISPTHSHQETLPPPPTKMEGKEEPWDKEVDDLVDWSSKLDEAALDKQLTS